MTNLPEKEGLTPNEKLSSRQDSIGNEENGQAAQSPEWMHRKYNFGPIHFPGYATPPVQLVVVALVCFMCPGMYNAINGLGGAGQLSAKVSDNANVAVYSTFSVVGFFAGSFANRLGLRLTLSFGGLGYLLFVSSYLSYNRNGNAGFVYFAGALLGVCAGLLWTAQGAIMLAYPDEASKGRYISWFWVIFNMGAVIGSLIPLGENLHSTAGRVSDGTYIGFMALTFTGAILAWCLVDARHVRRADGSHVVLMKHPTWKSEFLGLWQVLWSDPYIILLFPMFLASNWFYTYQPNVVSLPRFNVRTRSLNSTLYWGSQIVAALVFGYVLDLKSFRRTTKAKAALATLFVLTMTIWGGGYAWQKQYTRAETDAKAVEAGYVKLDWTSSGYVGPMFLYIFYGFFDAAWQVTVYWFMGAITNNGRKLANFVGFYKGIQSAGAAIAFRIDERGTSFMSEFATNWGLLLGALLLAAPVIFFKIRDTVPVEEDLKFSDETLSDVKPLTESGRTSNL